MPDKLTKYILDNGLTIYFYNDNSKHSVHAEIITKFGGMSKDFIYNNKEYHMKDGVAHLIEHFISEHGPKGDYIEHLKNKFISSNACTNGRITRYFIDGVENMSYALTTLLENVYKPNFTKENLDKVKPAIYEEIRRKNDLKFFDFNKAYQKNMFLSTDYITNLGTIKDIENLSLEDVKTCYKAFYTPNNQILIIAGNFDKDEYLNIIKEFFKDIEIPKSDVYIIKKKEPVNVRKNEVFIYKDTPYDYTSVNYKIDISNYSPKERLILESVLSIYLDINFSVISKARKKLIDNKIILNDIYTDATFYDDIATLSIEAYTLDNEAFVKNVQKIINDRNIDKELVELSIKKDLINFSTRFDYLSNIIMPFIDNIIIFNYPYLDEAKNFNISYDVIHKTINSLDFSNYLICHMNKK